MVTSPVRARSGNGIGGAGCPVYIRDGWRPREACVHGPIVANLTPSMIEGRFLSAQAPARLPRCNGIYTVAQPSFVPI